MRLLTLAVFAATVAAPAFAEDLQFSLVNNSSHDVTEMYLSPHEQDSWGENIIVDGPLVAGGTSTVTVADGETVCDYDIKVVTAEGTTGEMTQDICKLSTLTLHD